MMRCYECGGTYLEQHGRLDCDGDIATGVDWHECDRCGQKLLPLETCEALEKARKGRYYTMGRKWMDAPEAGEPKKPEDRN
jgi:hypothetical protein